MRDTHVPMKVFLGHPKGSTVEGSITRHMFGGTELPILSDALRAYVSGNNKLGSTAMFVSSTEVKAELEKCKYKDIVIQTTEQTFPRVRIPEVDFTWAEYKLAGEDYIEVSFKLSEYHPATLCIGEDLSDLCAEVQRD